MSTPFAKQPGRVVGRHLHTDSVTATKLQTNSIETSSINVTGTQALSAESIVLPESSDIHADPGAGRGRLWVLDSSPHNLIFTDDEGTDINMTEGGRSAGGLRPAADNLATVLSSGNDANALSIENLNNISFVNAAKILPASSTSATMIGNGAFGNGTKNIAIGTNARTTNLALTPVANGIAIGADTQAYTGGIAIGYDAQATDAHAVAIGRHTRTAGGKTVAIGFSASAQFTNAIAIGHNALVTGANGIAIGYNAVAAANGVCVGNNSSVAANGCLLGTGTVGVHAIGLGFGLGTVPANHLKIKVGTATLQTDLLINVRGAGAVALPTNCDFITVTLGAVTRRIELFTTA